MSWPTRALTEPVTILTAPREDDPYGRDVPDWEHASTLDTTARLQPAGEAETLVGRDEQQADTLAYLPAGTHITGRDRVLAGGATYEVVGPPRRWRVPWTDSEHHVRAALRKVDGL